jgi:hypothetical protein
LELRDLNVANIEASRSVRHIFLDRLLAGARLEFEGFLDGALEPGVEVERSDIDIAVRVDLFRGGSISEARDTVRC